MMSKYKTINLDKIFFRILLISIKILENDLFSVVYLLGKF